MIFLHYILPLALFYFFISKTMLLGLLLGNLVDLDHIYYRIIGNVPWVQSACGEIGKNCSFGVYPLHNLILGAVFLVFASLVFVNDKKLKLAGWICLGVVLNMLLDLVHRTIGFGI